MNEIVAVLVVPARGDPGGLLAHGALGCRPPVALNADTCGHDGHRGWRAEHEVRGSCYMCQSPTAALPLWWDGALVPEGWDRAVRVWLTGRRTPLMFPFDHSRDPTIAQAEVLAHDLVGADFASRVVLLARADGRLVEVAP